MIICVLLFYHLTFFQSSIIDVIQNLITFGDIVMVKSSDIEKMLHTHTYTHKYY